MSEAKLKRAPRPLKLLRALFEAQQEALEVPATTVTRDTDAHSTRESSYAGSEDTLRTARGILHRAGLMPSLVSSRMRAAEGGGKAIVTIEVSLLHVESGQELLRSYEVDVSPVYGAPAATTTGYAMALRLLLCLPREQQTGHIGAREPDPEPPRVGERRVYPAKLDEAKVAERVPPVPEPSELDRTIETGNREEVLAVCQDLQLQLADKRGAADIDVWKVQASVPIKTALSLPEAQRYADWLRRELAPPSGSGSSWPTYEDTD